MSWSEEDEAAFNDGVTMRFAGGKPAGGGTVLAGLAKGADARPGTCAAVLEGEKAAKPGGTRPRAAEPGRKRGALIAAGLLSLAAVAGVGGWRWWQGRQEAARIAEEQRQTEHKDPKPGEEMTITLPGGAPMTFCWFPAGSFTMGSPASEKRRRSDEKQHRVTLTQGFWMGKYEVTQAQWEGVMGSNPSRFEGANRPVEYVSWDDCQEFIHKVNVAGQVTASLPTEAQWEYACRAGTTKPFSFGSTLNGDKANCDGNFPYGTSTEGRCREETSEVGSYAPNAWGLCDMHGNVWEWCEDWYDAGYYGQSPMADPTGPSSGTLRVSRGGGWNYYARFCRSAYRYGYEPGNRGSNLGLRLVCSAGLRR